ncbi:polysaccharide pyruvyl transferase family protein [Variovorax robiniae]|uniref:Polysaccharide pyruvyl transferase family protein n=1 Tax=Variovorax robiniae TaxID=1836199 RepID=A0ABU8XJD5_9BURK
MKNWTLVGDVGGWEGYHVGDEAMLEANLDLFRILDPSAQLTVVSADPNFTSEAIGVDTAPRLGFDRCINDEERDTLLVVMSCMCDDEAPAAFKRLATPADGLVISGGGNLTSSWPNLICERLAFCRRAASVGAKIVILGQTIGPTLEPRHREMVREMLGLASWVGVREEHSFALAVELGVPPENLSYQLDDAAALALKCNSDVTASLPFLEGDPWIAITFHPITDPTVADPLWDRLAEQLKSIAFDTRCRLVFIPHAKAAPSLGSPWSDEDVGNALGSRLPEGIFIALPVMKAREVAALTRRARMIISSRYHPIVFGLYAAVPCLAVWTSEYTQVKLQGALSHYGRAEDACSVEQMLNGELPRIARVLWNRTASMKSVSSQELQSHVLAEELRKSQLRDRIGGNLAGEIELPARLIRALARIHRQADQGRKYAERKTAEITSELARASASLGEAAEYATSLELARVDAVKYAQSLEKNRLVEEERYMVVQKNMTEANLILSNRCEDLVRSVESATAHVETLQIELAARRIEGLALDDMREANRRLNASIAQLHDQLISLSKTHAALLASVAADRSKIELAEAEIQSMRAQHGALHQQLRQGEEHASNLQRQLQAMFASRSWRITRPMRFIKDMYRH